MAPKPYRALAAGVAGFVAVVSLGAIGYAWYVERDFPYFFGGLLGWALTILTGHSPVQKLIDRLRK